MFNLDNITERDENMDWPYRKLIIDKIDKIYLYAKDLEEPKYKFLIGKREQAGINFNNDPTAFIEYSNSMNDIFSKIENYNPMRRRKILIIFDDTVFHVMSDKKAQQVLKDLFIRCRKLNISLCFLIKSYFSVLKETRLNCTHYILFKLNNKRELQNLLLKIVKDQLKILDRKIKQNKADHDLYRQNAKISALSSGDLKKYEYLTNKDLGYKPDPLQKVKFENSPLGQVFNKRLKMDERSVGLLKRLNYVEDKTDNLNINVANGGSKKDRLL